MSIVLLPIKVVILMAILFMKEADIVLLLSGILIVLILLPKTGRVIGLFLHSGYMRAQNGQIYIVHDTNRATALSVGFRELSILQTATLTGSYSVWEGEK